MLKQLIRCTIWILGALLLIASVDAIPDPPAVNPHTVTMGVANERAENLTGYSSSPDLAAQLRTQGILAEDIEPACPSALIVRTGQAADPSPPARVGLSQA